MRNIPQFIVLSKDEHAILNFPMIADNGGRPIEHVLGAFVVYIFVLNKSMMCHLGVVFETHFFFPDFFSR